MSPRIVHGPQPRRRPAYAAAARSNHAVVASYYAATSLWSGSNGFLSGGDFEFKQKNSFGAGARVGVPVSSGFKIEGEFIYTWSGAEYVEDGAFGGDIGGGLNQDGNLIFGSVRALFSPRRSNLYFLAGPAIVSRGGDAWEGAPGDLTSFGGVAGIGINANVTPTFRINFTAETYLHSPDPLDTGSEFQADVLITFGVPIKLGGN
jgi:hypothetical protein